MYFGPSMTVHAADDMNVYHKNIVIRIIEILGISRVSFKPYKDIIKLTNVLKHKTIKKSSY